MIASRFVFVGLFLITLATLLLELLLVRIFSVTMWYHFAFMAVSIAMFGMTVGALWVYLSPGYKTESLNQHLSVAALFFGVTTLISFWGHLQLHFVPYPSLIGFVTLFATYIVICLPFIFSGITVCLCLTRFKEQIGKLYAFDLLGAAAGCLLLSPVIDNVGAVTAVAFVAFVGVLSALFFALSDKKSKIGVYIVAAIAAFAFLVVDSQVHLMRIRWVKGAADTTVCKYEKWNAISRIRVFGKDNQTPSAWGLSSVFPKDFKINEYYLDIDNIALTVLTAFDGDVNKVKHLRYDVTNLVHYIRPKADVGVVGVGAGRDVLSALVFDQNSVTGLEINKDIIKILKSVYNDFTGNLCTNPKVKIINSEARSYFASNKQLFDVIEISLIDTWAATSIGAHVLTENGLYTLEGWKIFYDRLKPNGILTCSRWYIPKNPAETYRLFNLAVQTLRAQNVSDPINHIVLIRSFAKENSFSPISAANLLMCKSAFTKHDLEVLENVCKEMNFEVLVDSNICKDLTFKQIAEHGNETAYLDSLPVNISAPKDDSPFFFQMIRMKDWLKWASFDEGCGYNFVGTFTLIALLIIVSILTLACILLPLFIRGHHENLSVAWPFFVFFSCIGMGFMFVEVSQLQRFSVLLGHPSYSLSVVLFSLLLATGIGSYFSDKFKQEEKPFLYTWAAILLGVLFAFGLISPHIVPLFQEYSLTIRIVISASMLFILGLALGTVFPLGMNFALKKSSSITPWLWGLNGATSVCASVIEVIVAQSTGISFAYWLGVAFYILAVIVLLKAVRLGKG